MARKTKAEAEATRDILLDTAEKIFFEQGVSGTSLEYIARQAGMTRGAVYWHFENKVALLEALILRVRLPLQELYNQLNTEHEYGPIESLRAIFLQVLSRCEEPHIMRVYTILLFRCEFFDQLSIRCQEKSYLDDVKSLIDDQLILASERQLLREGVDPLVMADILHYSMMGTIKEWLSRPDKFDLYECGSTMIEQLFNQFLSDPSQSEN